MPARVELRQGVDEISCLLDAVCLLGSLVASVPIPDTLNSRRVARCLLRRFTCRSPTATNIEMTLQDT